MAPVVCVIDDDASVRDSLVRLLGSAGFAAEAFSTAESFLTAEVRWRAVCLVVDLMMPSMTGPQLQDVLAAEGAGLPLIFISGQPREEIREGVMRAGAVAYLAKPLVADELLEIVAYIVGGLGADR
ncbi:Transcriptional regulatory protein zraR [Labilithrix luteola]|uniref:Transcriptional regulatory protein zraR n=1 Tax=Labilithrix luteola TaxID=1391654 RepID=A0A0K1PXT2_9BACT|nr:response regulator [Labilithrix luteola]AKU97954.1 Transcriptional regulatory protein zraR [Labilithrix luteola]